MYQAVKELELIVQGRIYKIFCPPGEQAHLKLLASVLERRMRETEQSVGVLAEGHLLFLTTLLILEELAITTATSEHANDEADAIRTRLDRLPSAESLSILCRRIESVAERIAKS